MNRKEVLETAARLVHGERQVDYGTPQTNFARIAALWEPIFGKPVTPTEVALALTQLKVARLIHSPAHADSWVDAAGYIAIGAELATGDSAGGYVTPEWNPVQEWKQTP